MDAFITRFRYGIALTLVNALVVGAGVFWLRRPPGTPLRLVEPANVGDIQCVADAATGPQAAAAGEGHAGSRMAQRTVARLSSSITGSRAARRSTGTRTSAAGPPTKVNVNRATTEELQALPGIGPALARRIVEYRQSHGPFKKTEDLLEVKGIGPVLLARIRDLVTLR